MYPQWVELPQQLRLIASGVKRRQCLSIGKLVVLYKGGVQALGVLKMPEYGHCFGIKLNAS